MISKVKHKLYIVVTVTPLKNSGSAPTVQYSLWTLYE